MSRSVDLVRAESSPPAVDGSSAAAAAIPQPAGPVWILNRTSDLLLFVATPLLIVPIVALAQMRFTIEQISLFVICFGAGGHHLPGMMRAYGDRALFQRFRTRFIVAPIFLVVFCIAFAQWDLNTLSVLTLMWGFWHGVMQVYGFVRIYDAKVGSFAKVTARLDWLMCLAWFGLGMILSPSRMGNFLDTYYLAGGPLIPPAAVHSAQDVWTALTIVVTVLFLGNYVRQQVRGRPANPLKLLIMASSFGFWWYAQVHITNILLGIALFEIFHDVQYLSIVWMFNRKRVSQDPGVGAFTRFLFRPSPAMAALYVGLCFAYGSTFLLGNTTNAKTAQASLFGMGIASTLLHFYFDGFIWKVRDKSTRAGLGLAGGTADAQTVPGWVVHGSKWLLLIVPAAALWYSELYARAPVIDRYRNIVAAVPNSAAFHHRLGLALKDYGATAEAEEQFTDALDRDPNSADSHVALAGLLFSQQHKDAAIEHWNRAIEINPNLAEPHFRLGLISQADGQLDAAAQHFQRAIAAQPDFADAHYGLALVLQAQGHIDEAIDHLREATRIKPDFVQANLALGNLLRTPRPAGVQH